MHASFWAFLWSVETVNWRVVSSLGADDGRGRRRSRLMSVTKTLQKVFQVSPWRGGEAFTTRGLKCDIRDPGRTKIPATLTRVRNARSRNRTDARSP